MPKLSDALNTFKTGDVIRMGVSPALHMAIFLRAAESPTRQNAFVHVAEVVTVEPTDRLYQPKTNFCPNYIHYSCPDAELGKKAAERGVRWARTTVPTPYGSTPNHKDYGQNPKTALMNRFGAMVTTGALDQIPFNINALVRVFKWAARANRGTDPLSANRGATCSAFVGACYQTAAFQQYLEEIGLWWNIERGYELAAGLLESKQAARNRRSTLPQLQRKDSKTPDPHARTGYASRAHSNKLLTNNEYSGLSTEEQWQKLYAAFYEASYHIAPTDLPQTIDQVIRPPFFYDVKYINAGLLSTALTSANWASTTYTQF